MDTHPELTPWVASVIVRSEYRRRGVGTILMKQIETVACATGFEKLYLFTTDMEAFYSSMKWQVIAREMFRSDEVVIMEKEIAA